MTNYLPGLIVKFIRVLSTPAIVLCRHNGVSNEWRCALPEGFNLFGKALPNSLNVR